MKKIQLFFTVNLSYFSQGNIVFPHCIHFKMKSAHSDSKGSSRRTRRQKAAQHGEGQ